MQGNQLPLQSPVIFGSIPSPGEALQSGGPLVLLRLPHAADDDAAPHSLILSSSRHSVAVLLPAQPCPEISPEILGTVKGSGRPLGSSVGQEGAQVEAAIVAQLAAVRIGLGGWPGGHGSCRGPARRLAVQSLLLLCWRAVREASLLQGNAQMRSFQVF